MKSLNKQNQLDSDKDTKVRIFIECTHTCLNGGSGGIQRVVRNLANHSTGIKITGVDITPIIWVGLGFCQPKSKVRIKPYFLQWFQRRFRQLLYLMAKKTSNWMKTCNVRFVRMVLQEEVRMSIYYFFRELSYFLMGLGCTPTQMVNGKFVSFRKGDIIVLADSTWRSQAMLDTLFKAQYHKGIKLGAMFYDLFPLLLPDTCDEITTRGFIDWFYRIIPQADFFIMISKTTRLSLQKFLDKNPRLRQRPYASGHFRLGAELDLANERSKKTCYLHPLREAPGMVILCIGTIEPRKNYAFMLDAFDILRQRNADISLIIIGRPGWKNSEIIERIRGHRDFGTRLLHFDNASDRDLAEAIERSDCLVCPSIAEGFGLPLVEGLVRGLVVFASDIPSFREIGNGYCHFFNTNSPVSLADQLEKWIAENRRGKAIAMENKFSWPDWEESTKEFIQLTLKLADSKVATQINGSQNVLGGDVD